MQLRLLEEIDFSNYLLPLFFLGFSFYYWIMYFDWIANMGTNGLTFLKNIFTS